MYFISVSRRLSAVRGQVTLTPETLTVLKGKEARFTCRPSLPEWTVMVWLMNGKSVLTISNKTGALNTVHPNVTAEQSGDGWVLVINRTERHNEGSVVCDLQGITTKTASLFVQGLYKVCFCAPLRNTHILAIV